MDGRHDDRRKTPPTQIELRVLNGLHRGAALVLDEETLRLGSGAQSDVLLLDPGIAGCHASIVRSDTGWALTAEEGRVGNRDGDALTLPTPIKAGDRFLLDGVWLGFDPVGTPWPAALPNLPTAAVEPTAPAPAPARPRRIGRGRIVVMSILAGLTLAAWGAAAGWALHQSEPPPPAPAPQTLRPVQAPPKVATPKLADLFRAELKMRELLHRVEFLENRDGWTLRGDLDADEQSRLERLLVKFEREHRPGFPIRASVLPAIKLLPFRIVQVSGGRNANIVTADGHRLYPGDTLSGYRLVAIEGNRLSFEGRRKLDVVW